MRPINSYIIYSRVSGEKQEVEIQDQMCREYIDKIEGGKPYSLQLIRDPDCTSRLPMHKRQGLVELRKYLRSGDRLVVFKLDRISRDIIEMVTLYREFKDKGVTLMSLNDNCDEFTVNLMAVLAQKERADISLRTKAGLKYVKSLGKRTSKIIPYGFYLHEDNETLIPKADEQLVLVKIYEMDDQKKTLGEIVKGLTELGIRNRSGNPFHKMSILRFLKARKEECITDCQSPLEKQARLSLSQK
jgi:DNA invertase Pin-like site-specific DNA recombinase